MGAWGFPPSPPVCSSAYVFVLGICVKRAIYKVRYVFVSPYITGVASFPDMGAWMLKIWGLGCSKPCHN